MKKIIFTAIVLLLAGLASAQKNKELKIQMEQLAKYKLQSTIVKEKNRIDEQGLDNISRYKNGTSVLYSEYFKSLFTVNVNIKNGDKAQYIRDVIDEIKRFFPSTITKATNSGIYERGEIAYFLKVYDNVLKDCNDIIRNLNAVTSNNQLEMSDDQRIERIDLLHDRMVSAYMFSRQFCNNIENIKRARERERQDTQRVIQLYGLDNNKKE
ncbi:hypothetical protein [Fluviicola sp.]|uniref:hypothetical protein n=1 Tax=Fluviicola sp. TaxID=1917219 RepID=UPI0031D445E7